MTFDKQNNLSLNCKLYAFGRQTKYTSVISKSLFRLNRRPTYYENIITNELQGRQQSIKVFLLEAILAQRVMLFLWQRGITNEPCFLPAKKNYLFTYCLQSAVSVYNRIRWLRVPDSACICISCFQEEAYISSATPSQTKINLGDGQSRSTVCGPVNYRGYFSPIPDTQRFSHQRHNFGNRSNKKHTHTHTHTSG